MPESESKKLAHVDTHTHTRTRRNPNNAVDGRVGVPHYAARNATLRNSGTKRQTGNCWKKTHNILLYHGYNPFPYVLAVVLKASIQFSPIIKSNYRELNPLVIAKYLNKRGILLSQHRLFYPRVSDGIDYYFIIIDRTWLWTFQCETQTKMIILTRQLWLSNAASIINMNNYKHVHNYCNSTKQHVTCIFDTVYLNNETYPWPSPITE